MNTALEKRLARLEKLVEERTNKPLVCNCVCQIRAHNSACLDAIVKGISRVCPVHGFRELGGFTHAAQWMVLPPDENPFCPCPPHPWRTFLMTEGPKTWEMHRAAKEAWHQHSGVPYNVEENNRRLTEIAEQYWAEREEWLRTSGRTLPRMDSCAKFQNQGLK